MPTTLQDSFLASLEQQKRARRFGVPDTDARAMHARNVPNSAKYAFAFSSLMLLTGPFDWSHAFVPPEMPEQTRLRDDNGRFKDDGPAL